MRVLVPVASLRDPAGCQWWGWQTERDGAVGACGVKGRPSGTVTFLFTDVEGSTRRWEADPDGMRVELAAHDETLRAAIESHDGWLFKYTGDGVCAAFRHHAAR